MAAPALLLTLLAAVLPWAAPVGAAAAPADLAPILAAVAAIEPWLVSTRRTFHAHPELFYQEHNTSATIRRFLDELGIPYK